MVKSIYGFHPIYRTRNTNLIGQFAYEDKRLHDHVETLGTTEDRSIYSYKLGFVGDFRDSVLGGGLNAFSAHSTEHRATRVSRTCHGGRGPARGEALSASSGRSGPGSASA